MSRGLLGLESFDDARGSIAALVESGWLMSPKVADQFRSELEPGLSALVNLGESSVALFVSGELDPDVDAAAGVVIDAVSSQAAAEERTPEPGDLVWRTWDRRGDTVYIGRHRASAFKGLVVSAAVQLQIEFLR